jgi:MFS family permease
MTALATPPTRPAAPTEPEPSLALGPQQVLVALAVLFVLFTPYQTLVQTVLTDDAIRLGIEVDDYDMTWTTAAYGIGVLYGTFVGLSLAARIGARATIALGMLVFMVGDILCGAAGGFASYVVARFVEGFGKMCVMIIGRATLYKHFERNLLVAIGFYGVFAYATRHITPLVNAYLDVSLSWRWTFWAYVPVGLVATALVWRFLRPDRPSKPMHIPIDWLAVTGFVAWVVAVVFAFSWYRKWGGWSSNAFAATVIFCVIMPFVLAAWLGSGFSRDEHLQRLVRSRVYVLCLMTRGLMLLHLVAVLTIIGMYCTELRGYPRIVAGWLMVPASLSMGTTTFLTTRYQRRALRHVWLTIGFVGAGACVWWMSSIDNFTPKGQLAVMLACWGAFVGLIPPAYLLDEVEGLERRDMLYAAALGLVAMVTPIITVPTVTGTMIKAWSDRALDVYRLNLRENRPPVSHAMTKVADDYHQKGLTGADLQHETARVLGGFAALESVAYGFRNGLRFLSLTMLGLGLMVALSLGYAARGLRAPPAAGYV